MTAAVLTALSVLMYLAAALSALIFGFFDDKDKTGLYFWGVTFLCTFIIATILQILAVLQ